MQQQQRWARALGGSAVALLVGVAATACAPLPGLALAPAPAPTHDSSLAPPPLLELDLDEVPWAGGALPTGAAQTRAQIHAVLRRELDALRVCHEHHLDRGGRESGRVVLRFVVDARGTVTAASIVESAITDAIFQRCLVRAVEGLGFPPRHEPAAVAVMATLMLALQPHTDDRR